MSAPEDHDREDGRKPEARTVLIPGSSMTPETPAVTPPPPAPPAPEPAAASWGEVDAAAPPVAADPPAPPAVTPPPAPPPPSSPPVAQMPTSYGSAGARTYAPMAPRTNGNRVEVGDVLNHIFEVKRFIARGGMGEVFEGVNVSSDERVAIKVMLPALAADPNVVAMFRKEARTLTKLAHPALVAYRVLAQEPQLDLLYIVTEYVDGVNLSDVLGEIKPTPEELRGLARRLAEGLRAAHLLGAIHRDISPDNVLLEDRRLDRAKVIDFGIAKDLDPTTKTIVGDGFAGKLNYVAPEQLGDFGREIGPWTDVYSLALVILAVSQGRDSDMGATLVDAVDRRRAGPDLSKIPSELQPVLHQMLVADPAKRLRSMDAVIAALDGTAIETAPAATPVKAAKPPKPPKEPRPAREPKPLKVPSADGAAAKPSLFANRWVMIGGAAAAVLLLVLVAVMMSGGKKPAETAQTAPSDTPAAVAADTKPPAERARAAIEAALPAVACSWLDIDKVADGGGGVSLRGVAGDPATAQARVSQALSQVGLSTAAIDFSDVTTVGNDYCAAVDVLRPLRLVDGASLTVEQKQFELLTTPAGIKSADVLLDIEVPPTGSFAILGIEPGASQLLSRTRATFADLIKTFPGNFKQVRDNSFQMTLETNHTGLSGIALLTSTTDLTAADQALLESPLAKRDAAWQRSVAAAAAKGGWHTQMVWFRTVDEKPD